MSAQLANALPADQANQYAAEMAEVIVRLVPSGVERLARLTALKEKTGVDANETETRKLLEHAHHLVSGFYEQRRASPVLQPEQNAKDVGNRQPMEVSQ